MEGREEGRKERKEGRNGSEGDKEEYIYIWKEGRKEGTNEGKKEKGRLGESERMK